MILENIFEQKEDDYYRPIRAGNFYSNNYIEYESNGDSSKRISVKEYLNEIKPYLRDMIIDLQKSDAWKIQLTMSINFICSKDVDEESAIHTNSDNIEIMAYDEANEVIEELFDSLFSRYQVGLKTSMKGSDYITLKGTLHER